jgi:predicted CXXCH cytochrome family protein
MTRRLIFVGLALAGSLSAATVVHSQQNPYRLKDPDQKKLCLACHTDFEQKLKSRFVHTPVKTGECSGCHEAHVSSHGKLLSDEPREMCARCHGSVIPATAKSTHKVAADGDCQKCHDPHASDNAANLRATGNELCFGCHKDVAGAVKAAKFRHAPVEQGCQTCHAAHASDQAGHLLKAAVPALCLNCHKPSTPAFQAKHMKYPVATASCTSCHDPHGSSQPALLQNSVHPALASGGCNQCHLSADSATPFATKSQGFELCKGCHSEAVNTMLGRKRLHWPIADQQGCVNCHNPHASRYDKLLKQSQPQLCATCHDDTLKRNALAASKHAPVDGGTCTACHSPHSSDSVYLVDKPSIVAACSTCHDYSAHSAHPIGDKAVDPRNKNLRVDCLSCHKAHGTEFKHMLRTETNVELCTQCHTKYAR